MQFQHQSIVMCDESELDHFELNYTYYDTTKKN